MKTMLAAAAVLGMTVSASAAEVATPSEKRAFVYGGVIDDKGRVDVRLTNPPVPPRREYLNVYAPKISTVQSLIRSQDWYLKVGAEGRARGLYTVPSGNALSSNVVRGLSEGQSLLKVTPQSSFMKVFPAASEMKRDVEAFANATRDAVCALQWRPSQVRARLNVKPGWSAGGTIRLDATWDTASLCAKAATAKAKPRSGALRVVPAKAKARIAKPTVE